MRSTSWIWRFVSALSLVTTILLLGGFIYAVKDVLYPTAQTAPVNKDAIDQEEKKQSALPAGDIRISAVGDSLAKGTGDDTGKGFARRTAELLQAENKQRSVKFMGNLGINGLTTVRLIPMLEETGVQHMLKEANVILLSIGGNDLFQGAGGAQSVQTLPSKAQIKQASLKASKNLGAVVRRVHEINPEAKLIYVGLYNPFSDMKDMKAIGNQAVDEWNGTAWRMISQVEGANVVPTYDLFVNNLTKYLSDDHFHPNGDGYDEIAKRIVQGLK